MPIIAMGLSCRDQDHRRALQSLLSGKLSRADRHHLGLRRDLNAILPDGHAAARGVDEATSHRAPGGMALRDWQTRWQGSLGRKAAFLGRVKSGIMPPVADILRSSRPPLYAAGGMPSHRLSNDTVTAPSERRPLPIGSIVLLPELHIEFLCAIRSSWHPYP